MVRSIPEDLDLVSRSTPAIQARRPVHSALTRAQFTWRQHNPLAPAIISHLTADTLSPLLILIRLEISAGNDFLGHIRRHLLIAVKHHLEGSTPPRDRT